MSIEWTIFSIQLLFSGQASHNQGKIQPKPTEKVSINSIIVCTKSAFINVASIALSVLYQKPCIVNEIGQA